MRPLLPSIAFLTLLLASGAQAEVTSFPVLPSATDAEIKTFDQPHWIYINRDIVVSNLKTLPADRHELLLWLPGTGSKGHDAQAFATLAADLGYHVVTLMYPDDTPASICAQDSNPKSFEDFRLAIIQGGTATIRDGQRRFSVERAEAIENRLVKLLRLLQQRRPKENWGQFLTDNGSIKWETIAVAGHSQGGGHAALIGIKHPVARVICLGAPKDYNQRLKAPAAFYNDPSATPKARFFAFNHRQDSVVTTPEQMLKNLNVLGLATFGAPSEVDTEASPYHHSRILYTRYPKVVLSEQNGLAAYTAHGSVINSTNAARWKPIWTYLLTEPTQ